MTTPSNGVTIYYEPQGCNCDNKTTYDQSAIHAACVQSLSLAKEGKQIGRDKYPHAYNDTEHFSFAHAQAPYFEFPILSNGSTYDGGEPGADRVVVGSVASDYSSAVYCATLTHSGTTDNKFLECENTSKADYTATPAPEDRDLLKPADVKVPFYQPPKWLSNHDGK